MSSAWEIKPHKGYPPLEENIDSEVVIVGGGLAGIWCAYLLAQEGKSVVVIEKDRLGHGETMYTTAFITQSIDTSLNSLVSMFGESTAKLVWRSGRDAINLIENAVKKESIECEFERVPLTLYAKDDDEYHTLEEEHRWARKFGFDTTLKRGRRLGFKTYGVLDIENQAKYHPMKFFYGLIDIAEKMGVKFFEDTEVLDVLGTGPLKVVTIEGNTLSARQVVVTTYEPFNNPKPIHFKKGMYISYVYEYRVKSGKVVPGLYIDLANPYHYMRVDRLSKGWDRMVVGGEDHREDIRVSPIRHFRALEQFVDETFPLLDKKFVRRWKGKILEPSDGLPLIGEVSPEQYIATAFSGNGMTYAPISGKIISDLIMGRKNSYEKIYNADRKLKLKAVLHKARDYTGEFIGGAGKNLFK